MSNTVLVGLPGAGKTYALTRKGYRIHKRHPDKRIVANYPLFLPGGRPVEFIESMEEVWELSDCVLFLDECQNWMEARSWNKRDNLRYTAWVSQLRKRHVELFYTTQNISSVDKLLRDRTHYCYQLDSWRRLGFFKYNAYFGAEPKKGNWYYSGFYLWNIHIAHCYETDFVVGF